MHSIVIILFFLLGGVEASSPPKGKVHIPAGEFSPLYGLDVLQKSFKIEAFDVDVNPVTNKDYAAFLKTHPEWTKNKVFPLFVDSKYLDYWRSDSKYNALSDAPITMISWYAAGAFCESKNGRLLTTLEWEYIAAASETQADASKDPELNQKLLDLYSKPQIDTSKQSVKLGKPNFYGVKNLHGIIWEWTNDFNSFFIASDNRSDGDKSKNMFCGAGSIGAKEKENYAAFIRYGYRGSLQARYATKNLGFRCAYTTSSVVEEKKK